jgi:hypothetical protein
MIAYPVGGMVAEPVEFGDENEVAYGISCVPIARTSIWTTDSWHAIVVVVKFL